MLSPIQSIPGLVWAYHILPGENRAERISADSTGNALAIENGFFWLHLNLADARVGPFLERIDGLTEAARTTLLTHDPHVALTVDEQMLHGTLIDFQREFDATTRDIGWLHFALTDKFIITTRLQPIRSIDMLRAAIERNAAKYLTPMHIFETLVAEYQRRMISLVLELTEELNVIEDFVYDAELRDERSRLAPVRRVIVRLHRHLRTMLAMIRRAAAADDDEMLPGFEDTAHKLMNRLEAADHDVYALQERARLLHEELDSKLQSETNRHLYMLSVMTALMLPPTLVTGFFGMNTSALPFEDGSAGTFYAFGLIGVSILLSLLLLRRGGIL